MKLAELIKNTSWLSVRLSLRKMFNSEDEIDLKAFKSFFNSLKNTTPSVSEISLQITRNINPVTGEKGYRLSGIDLGPKKRRMDVKMLLEKEYTSWEKWLGMEIDDETLKEFSIVEIIGICMVTVHIINSDPDIILNELNNYMASRIEDEKISKEEKIGELISSKDLKNYFNLS
jgi:hypothetical protein